MEGKPRTQPAFSDTFAATSKSVTFCKAKDMLPFNIVEKKGFKRMAKVFDLHYQLPSQNYFSCTAIPALYTELHKI